MRSTELHGERRGWNLHLVGRVVRFAWFFLKVRIFRNVRHGFQNFIAHHVSATAAKWKDGVAHQDDAGARLILMTYLVNPRLLDQVSRNQRAIALIVYFNSCLSVRVLQFHIVALYLFFCCLPPTPKLGCGEGSYKLVLLLIETQSFAALLRATRAGYRQGQSDKGFIATRWNG